MTKAYPFNRPTLAGSEVEAILDAIERRHISGNGSYTKQCHNWLQNYIRGSKALLTHSCTAALEMSGILAGLEPGDEVIMPSFTFTSTANAFVLRRATPVFVDVREDTLNIDETLIEAAITPKTKAICVVHYAGVAAEMDAIMSIAARHGLFVIEDAAQAMFATYKGRPLGSIGHMSAFSFHETKNIMSGEGGALIVNDPSLRERSEIIWEKGTDRAKFERGEVAKYSWVDVGSSFLPSDIIAAFLLKQLESGAEITRSRLEIWNRYQTAFQHKHNAGVARCPTIPSHCAHNGHIFFLLVSEACERDRVLARARAENVSSIIHYVPLHSAPAGLRFGRLGSTMAVTDSIASRLIRLPLHVQLDEGDQSYIIDVMTRALENAPATV
ncbi:dTDP-4-amino-4,6-dideoxygalactose transaminase [Bosea sp. OAE506]|uniref:dTDP-4-amino-4,6-dideoxygalactose transaminase n=1 Tax=Bosea sp. OAE506 TaxID=2663870 RepID=UPI00178BCC75